MKPDLSDIFIFIGMVILGLGIWLIYPPFALIVLGAILFLIGIASAKRKEGG